MGVYSIELPDKRVLDIEAADQDTAIRGAQEWHAGNPQGPLGRLEQHDFGDAYRGANGEMIAVNPGTDVVRDGFVYPRGSAPNTRTESSLTQGMRGAARSIRGASTPDNVLAGGIETAANWLDWAPEPGADTLAPLGAAGIGAMGLGVLGRPDNMVGVFGGRLRGPSATHAPVDSGGGPAAVVPKAQGAAEQMIADTLTRAGKTPEELRTILANMDEARHFHSSGVAQDRVALGDLDESLTRLAGSIARQSPEAARSMREFIHARQTGHTPRNLEPIDMADRGLPTREAFTDPILGRDAKRRLGRSFDTADKQEVPMGLVDSTVDAMRRAFLIKDADYHGHALTGRRTEQQIIERRRDAADINYNATYEIGKGINLRGNIDPVFESYLAMARANEPPLVENLIKRIQGMFRTGHIEIKQFDRTKRAVDDIIKSFLNRTDRSGVHAGGVLNDLKNDLLSAIDKVTVGGMPPVAPGRIRLYRGGDSEFLTADIKKASSLGPVQFVDVPNTAKSMKRFKEGPEPGTLTTTSSKVMDSLRHSGVGPAYRAARDEFSTDARMIDAYRRGLKGLDDDAEVTADDFLSLAVPGEQKLFLFGLLDSARLRGDRMPHGHDFTKVFKTPRVEKILTAVIPRSQGKNDTFADRPRRFGRYVDAQSQMIESRNTVQGGSTTMRNAADDAANEVLQAIALKEVGSFINMFSNSQSLWHFGQQILTNAIDKAFGVRADVAKNLAEMLFTADAAQRSAILDSVARRMPPTRMERFNQIMTEYSQTMEQGGPAALRSALNEEQQPRDPKNDK